MSYWTHFPNERSDTRNNTEADIIMLGGGWTIFFCQLGKELVSWSNNAGMVLLVHDYRLMEEAKRTEG